MGMSPAEAAAAGVGWVDENHPLYGTKGYAGYKEPTTAPVDQNFAAPAGAGAGGSVPQQAQNASTYSQTPGGAPTGPTSNQGTQDVVRNSWLQQATQGTEVDRNDPNFRQQVDPFAAAQERTRRTSENEAAERLSAQGLGSSGQMDNERRLAAEHAGQATGAFESQLVGRELENRRNEIKTALTSMQGMISDDQKMALQKQLADLDAAIKREGIQANVNTSAAELGVKDRLGTGALNVDIMRALLQNQQFGDSQALDWSKFDWSTNPMNPNNWG